MVFFLLSLAGIPITSGFMGKFYVFSAAIKSRYNLLILIALANSAFAAFYYMKIIVQMYMPDKERLTALMPNKPESNIAFGISNGKVSPGLIIIILICLLFTLIMGIYPQIFINFANNAISSLLNV